MPVRRQERQDRQEEKLICSAVAAEASTNPTGALELRDSLSELSHLRPRNLIFISQHWPVIDCGLVPRSAINLGEVVP